MLPCLVWNSLCKVGWSLTHRDPLGPLLQIVVDHSKPSDPEPGTWFKERKLGEIINLWREVSFVSHSYYSWVKLDWPAHLSLGYLKRHSERIQRPARCCCRSSENPERMVRRWGHSSQSNERNWGSGGKRKRRPRGRNEISVQSYTVDRWAEQLQNYKGCCWFLALSKSLPLFSAVQLFVWWGCLLTSLCVFTENHIIIFRNATQDRSKHLTN